MSPARGLCAILSAICLTAAAPAQAAKLGHAPLWRLTSPSGAQITLLGSIHSLTEAKHWRSPEFDRTLRTANEIWTEAPTTGPRMFGDANLYLKGELPPGQRLDQIISPELYHRVEALEARGHWSRSRSLLPRLRPWLAEMSIENVASSKPEKEGGDLMDDQIARSAPAKVHRHSFETADQLPLSLMNQPEAQQIESLQETVDALERSDREPDEEAELVAAYSSGDLAGLVDQIAGLVQRYGPLRYQRDVIERNAPFARRIEALAKTRKKILVVVGLGHLVGPDSIPTLLTRDGFRVTVL